MNELNVIIYVCVVSVSDTASV